MPWHSYLLHEYVYFEQRMAVGLLMRLYFCKITLEIFNGNANVFVWHRSKQRKKNTRNSDIQNTFTHNTQAHIIDTQNQKKKKNVNTHINSRCTRFHTHFATLGHII